ncbi:MAG TPA: hypothetical protein VKB46_18830 [Pyrinomonadaceae bacterium]|nr:hypothetical protein [Pyrinomonadaceae bacterium]
MKLTSSRLCATIPLFLFALLWTTVVIGQTQKPWTEWSAKEAQQMLSSSPWAQTQVDTNLAEMFYSPTTASARGNNSASRTVEGATNQEVKLFYYIRFFSARPVRKALARLYEIKEKPDKETTAGLHNFAELQSSNLTIVAVAFECSDGRFSGKVMQAFQSAVTSTLKNKTYLERSDGKRLFLEEYVPPGPDGFGARFIFPRVVDGKEFITPDVNEIRFLTEVDANVKLNMRFKTASMMLDGKMEY